MGLDGEHGQVVGKLFSLTAISVFSTRGLRGRGATRRGASAIDDYQGLLINMPLNVCVTVGIVAMRDLPPT